MVPPALILKGAFRFRCLWLSSVIKQSFKLALNVYTEPKKRCHPTVCVLGGHVYEQVTAETGQTVTLSCRATKRNIISVVVWKRVNLEEEGYVLLYRNKHYELDEQLPSFKGRVELKEGWKEDGDVSVILKNVSTEDSGRYECRVKQEGTKTELINTIRLSVGPSGHSGGHVGLIVGLVVGVLLVALIAAAAVVGLMIYRRCQKKSSSPPPDQPSHSADPLLESGP
ncbi:junctional adhesion molecule B-like [Parambassis ranga]|uniref:Junctional adhesion molecule B-like n=1 Tax=Parambassis ranga TaxID=210632 RepID=A0A6P7I4K6_9TELE|nr:junctional adhesion molecule B-like [Parambassis ranga]